MSGVGNYFIGAGLAMAGFALGVFVTLMTIKFEVGCRSRRRGPDLAQRKRQNIDAGWDR